MSPIRPNVLLKTRRKRVHVVDVPARPYPLLQRRLVRKLHRLEQMQRRRVRLVLVQHPVMRVVHKPGIVAGVVKPDRRAGRRNGHRRAGPGHAHGWSVRAFAGGDDDGGHRLSSRVSVATPAARPHAHIALPRRAPRPKQPPQWLLPLVPRPKEPPEPRRRAREGLRVAHEHLRAVVVRLHIDEVWDLRGEVREDVSVRRRIPYVHREVRERVVGRREGGWSWSWRGHPHRP